MKTKRKCNSKLARHDGSCCCNCEHQKKLMCHPWNKGFGEGEITKRCGWVCDVFTDKELDPKGDWVMFSDRKHGMCELWTARETLKI